MRFSNPEAGGLRHRIPTNSVPSAGSFEMERLGLPLEGQRNRSTSAGQSSTLVFANTNNPYGTASLFSSWDIITEHQFVKKGFRALPRTFTYEIIPKAGSARAHCDRCFSYDQAIFLAII